MKILVLGADGMLGHVVVAYLRERCHEVITTSRKIDDPNYYDAFANVYNIEPIITKHQPNAVVNCIGILNAAAENNHALAVMVNSFLPNYLDLLSTKYNFKLVHVTTDCVFDGTDGNYDESAQPNATSFYGISKAMGEVKNDRTLTLRTSIVGPDANPKGIGLFQWFSQQSGVVNGYAKVWWTGVTTIELARVIEEGIKNNVCGLNHVVNNEKISKGDLLKLFEKYFNFGISVVDETETVCDKSLVRTSKSYDFGIPSYEEMVKNMKKWVDEHADLYPVLKERMA